MKNHLKEFEGKPVIRSTIQVTNAGDGLSAAMKISPVEYEHGETVCIVLECEVVKVNYLMDTPDDPDSDLIRQHTFKAGTATVVERSLVGKILDQQREAIRKADEEESGIQRLPGTENAA